MILKAGSRDYRFIVARQMARKANVLLGKKTLIRGGWEGDDGFGGTVSHSRRFQVRVDASRDIGMPICSVVDWTGDKNSGLEGGGSRYEYRIEVPLAGWDSYESLVAVLRQVLEKFGLRKNGQCDSFEAYWSSAVDQQFLQQLMENSQLDTSATEQDPLVARLGKLQIPSSLTPGDVLRTAARRIGLVHQFLGSQQGKVGYSYKGIDPLYGFDCEMYQEYNIFAQRFEADLATSTLKGPFMHNNWRDLPEEDRNFYQMALALEDTLDPKGLGDRISTLLLTKLGKKIRAWQKERLPQLIRALSNANVSDEKKVVIHGGTLLDQLRYV